MSNEEKWKANLQKVSFLRTFPGWLSSWEQGIGSTIEHIHTQFLNRHAHTVLLLSQEENLS